jgi:shikimate dehydrogenase
VSEADRYALLGHPVAHSRSPGIHRAFAEQTGENLQYHAIDVQEEAFGAFWRTGEGRDLKGANITLPLKELAFKRVDTLTLRAQQAGAVNTIKVETDGRLLGDNTDGYGLVRDLTVNLGLELTGTRLLLIGAGGAAAGVLGQLLSRNPQEVVVANRSRGRAAKLCRQFGEVGYVVAAGLDELPRLGHFDGILNATSAGHQGEVPGLPESLLETRPWCYDMNYGKVAEPFLVWAQMHQSTGHDGLGMLVEQAAESFMLWRGARPETAEVLAGLRNPAAG